MEGRAPMETYQLMRAAVMEARTSPVVNVDWSAAFTAALSYILRQAK